MVLTTMERKLSRIEHRGPVRGVLQLELGFTTKVTFE